VCVHMVLLHCMKDAIFPRGCCCSDAPFVIQRFQPATKRATSRLAWEAVPRTVEKSSRGERWRVGVLCPLSILVGKRGATRKKTVLVSGDIAVSRLRDDAGWYSYLYRHETTAGHSNTTTTTFGLDRLVRKSNSIRKRTTKAAITSTRGKEEAVLHSNIFFRNGNEDTCIRDRTTSENSVSALSIEWFRYGSLRRQTSVLRLPQNLLIPTGEIIPRQIPCDDNVLCYDGTIRKLNFCYDKMTRQRPNLYRYISSSPMQQHLSHCNGYLFRSCP